MTLLDRFRTQPQNHPDPAVRLAYLAELPITERDQIVAAAREDADPRVRKAAVAKILDPQVLAGIVATLTPALPFTIAESPRAALEIAWGQSSRIVIAGSIFLRGDVMKELAGS